MTVDNKMFICFLGILLGTIDMHVKANTGRHGLGLFGGPDNVVSALDPFFRPLNTITSAILNTNRFGCRLYLGIFILFYSTNYTIQLYYLRIIYLARVLFLLPFAICASCKFGGKREKRCQRKCQNRRREDRREVRGKGEQKMVAIFWRRK